ncbi:MAG: amidophosphoribosyltransferase [Bacteroidia bacterium]|nr:amidophosphoribosyltransferase [Bacteroidia bacterium]
MSEQIKHECGIGLIRLLKPMKYYQVKYGNSLWGLSKMYILLEKMRNRGQDGAGLGCVKLNVPPGVRYHARAREIESPPLNNLFKKIESRRKELRLKFPKEDNNNPEFLNEHYEFAADVYLGHLRYGTHSSNSIDACHPVSRISNWRNRSLLLAGNFNMTNVDELIAKLLELGQHPRHSTDTETVLEKIGHFLDEENKELYTQLKEKYPEDTDLEIAFKISENLDIRKIFSSSAKAWDGGYVMGGIVGNGDAFIARDPNGIRPCFYYYNEEFLVAASERAAISTVFGLQPEEISELPPAHILSVKALSNEIKIQPFTEAREKRSCSFERIYFSRGTDKDIYTERKDLGRHVVPNVLKAIDYDVDNTVFSFIPNTAEIAFQGLIEGLQQFMDDHKVQKIRSMGSEMSLEALSELIHKKPRVERAVIKDVKMRTFIATDDSRSDLVSMVYDTTPGILRPGIDNLVCIDDSIVRGTTLNESILKMLARLNPKKIIIVSSAPQIRYPDCYGIDMSRIDKLIAFNAAIDLIYERNMHSLIHQTYDTIRELKANNLLHTRNVVQDIYAPFSEEEISDKIAQILKPKGFPVPVQIVYQPLSNLPMSIPNHTGDWYFSGNYPTPGGNRVSNQSFLNYYDKIDGRAYQIPMF